MSDSAIAYVEAYACSDFGDGPEFATFALTTTFLARLHAVRAVVKEHSLSEARIYAGPDEWGPGDVADDLRLNCAELVVTGDTFWFVDQPKHADYHIETRAIPFDALDEALASGELTAIFGAEPQALEQRVSETAEAG